MVTRRSFAAQLRRPKSHCRNPLHHFSVTCTVSLTTVAALSPGCLRHVASTLVKGHMAQFETGMGCCAKLQPALSKLGAGAKLWRNVAATCDIASPTRCRPTTL